MTTELLVCRCSQQGVPVSTMCVRNKQTLEWVRGQLIFFLLFTAQALKEDFPLSHVIPFTNQERREGMLLNLLIPFVLTVGSGSKGLINLTKEIYYCYCVFLSIRLFYLPFPFGAIIRKLDLNNFNIYLRIYSFFLFNNLAALGQDFLCSTS